MHYWKMYNQVVSMQSPHQTTIIKKSKSAAMLAASKIILTHSGALSQMLSYKRLFLTGS